MWLSVSQLPRNAFHSRCLKFNFLSFFHSSLEPPHCSSTRRSLQSITQKSIHSHRITTTLIISVDRFMADPCRRIALMLRMRVQSNPDERTYRRWPTTNGFERQLMVSNLRWMQSIKYRNNFRLRFIIFHLYRVEGTFPLAEHRQAIQLK